MIHNHSESAVIVYDHEPVYERLHVLLDLVATCRVKGQTYNHDSDQSSLNSVCRPQTTLPQDCSAAGRRRLPRKQRKRAMERIEPSRLRATGIRWSAVDVANRRAPITGVFRLDRSSTLLADAVCSHSS